MATEILNDDQILDFDLDSLEDLPEFYNLPAGSYLVDGVSMHQEMHETFGTQVAIKVKIVNTMELLHPETDTPPTEGLEVQWKFGLEVLKKDGSVNEIGTKFSQGQIKMITSICKQAYGTATFKEAATKFPGTRFGLVTGLRKYKDKDGNERFQSELKQAAIME